MRKVSYLLLIALPGILAAQTAPDPNAGVAAILERLDKLERQNEELTAEIRALRSELAPKNISAAAGPPLEDRVAVVESRVEEQAQSKVEASQRFPISLTGMVLFNAFSNSESGYGKELYGAPPGLDRTGATLAQTLLGFDFNGPEIPGNGKIGGSINFDFYGGGGPYGHALRIRRGVVDLDWAHRAVTAGQDKPLISQRQPDSLAEVGYPPLADAGNPWLWVPQLRYVEHIRTGENSGVDAAISLLQTSETYAGGFTYGVYSLEPARPGLEARVNIWRQSGNSRFELAPGLHMSDTHVNGFTVPSRFATLDWLFKPVKWMRITGLVFGGQNMANLGGFLDGFTVEYGAAPHAVRGVGGWTQFAFPLTTRLTLNAFGGLQAPRISDVSSQALTHESAYAANLIYRLSPNVLLGVEALQERIGYFDQPHVIRNRYDLAIGYLF